MSKYFPWAVDIVNFTVYDVLIATVYADDRLWILPLMMHKHSMQWQIQKGDVRDPGNVKLCHFARHFRKQT